MMKSTALVMLLTFGCVDAAYACSCIRQHDDPRTAVKAAFDQADLVFLGRIEGAETFKVNDEDFEVEYERTQFYILRSWKGETSSRVYIQSPLTCCLCGYDFPRSGVFLVYAYGPDEDGYYSTSSCDRTEISEEAENDVALLNDITIESRRTNRSSRSREERAPAER